MAKSEKPTIFRAERTPLTVTFLVFSGSSIMCVASAIDPLRAANRISGETLFDFKLVSVDGAPPVTTCGLPVAVSGRFDPAEHTDVLVVVAGFGTQGYATPALPAGLAPRCALGARLWRRRGRHLAGRPRRPAGGPRRDHPLGGHGGFCRRLSRHRCAARPLCHRRAGLHHRRRLADLRPDAASVRSRLGMAVALDVASVFIYDQSRAATDAQPLVSLGRLDGYDPRLAQAIRLMEAHVDQPLTIAAIAKRAGVTPRTLESIFRKSIGETPGAYYLRLRLNAARRLVVDTRVAMADIAARTGFSSAAAFSRAFSRAFGSRRVQIDARGSGQRGVALAVAISAVDHGAHLSGQTALQTGCLRRDPIQASASSSSGQRHRHQPIDD